MITAVRANSGRLSIALSSVVLPLPRKPVSKVTGRRSIRSDGEQGWRALEKSSALLRCQPRNDRQKFLRGYHLPHIRQIDERSVMQFSVIACYAIRKRDDFIASHSGVASGSLNDAVRGDAGKHQRTSAESLQYFRKLGLVYRRPTPLTNLVVGLG